MTTLELLQKTRAAMGSIAAAGAEKKNALLLAMADSLEAHCAEILAANAEDMAAARGRITDVMLDRLKLDENRIAGMANGIRDTVRLPDHTGRVLSEVVRPNGIVIDKVQVPLGLVAIIYESRPNVTSDAAALAVKSGNVCMLRSGKEAYRSARAIVAALKAGVAQAGGDPDIVNIVEDTSHASAQELMTAKGLVDLLIPRGGAGLIRACVENATVPCIETGTGICHVYVDKAADLAKAVNIIVNAKASRPSVCNAEEVCLVHRDVAAQFLPLLKKAIVDDRAAAGLVPVELRLPRRGARLRHRVSRLHSRRRRGGQRGRRHRAHRRALHAPQRLHRDRGRRRGEEIRRAGGQRGGLRQRLHPLHRRRRVRPRLRDGHFHAEAPRPRAHGPRRAVYLQIRRPRQRTDPVRRDA